MILMFFQRYINDELMSAHTGGRFVTKLVCPLVVYPCCCNLCHGRSSGRLCGNIEAWISIMINQGDLEVRTNCGSSIAVGFVGFVRHRRGGGGGGFRS